jgi:hypothetical protein
MSEKKKFCEVSEQWRSIPEVAVLADGHHFRQFRQLEHFGKGFHLEFFLKGIGVTQVTLRVFFLIFYENFKIIYTKFPKKDDFDGKWCSAGIVKFKYLRQ